MLSGANQEAHDDNSINRQQDIEGDERKGRVHFFVLKIDIVSYF
jgi:hypothetical protein